MKNIATVAAMLITMFGCSNNPEPIAPNSNPAEPTYKYIALGDSYTIGESVCGTCRFPEQLKESLTQNLNEEIFLRVIAQTGWTTTDLQAAIANQHPASDYDLVTLLIGVNNQYQNRPFALYEQEFPELVATAISLGKGDKNNVIVVSIPDYGFTPFGQGNQAEISAAIDQYNAFAQSYCESQNIRFINITDITREGIENPELVATDGLHPSEIAYSRFVDRLLPTAIDILGD